MPEPPPVVLFDGDCPLCNAVVRWSARRDPLARLRYASLGSPVAPMVVALADPERDFGALPDSVVLVDRAGIHTESEAVLRMARRLRFPYPLLGALARVVPQPIRDAAYRAIALRRGRWFNRGGAGTTRTEDSRSRTVHASAGTPAAHVSAGTRDGHVPAATPCRRPPSDFAARMLDENDLADLKARAADSHAG